MSVISEPFLPRLSFVRRGNRLQGKRAEAWEENARRFLIDVPRLHHDTSVDPSFRLHLEDHFAQAAPLIIEIGSGLGDAILHAASQHPDINFLALEVYLPGLAQTVRKAAQRELSNLRVLQANAPEILATALPPESVSEFWTFFPDPWPKRRHEKRRLITPTFAELMTRRLAPQGVWRIATDWEHYADSIAAIGAKSSLHNPYDGWSPRFHGRIVTNFERKALASGRTVHDLTFVKAAPTS